MDLAITDFASRWNLSWAECAFRMLASTVLSRAHSCRAPGGCRRWQRRRVGHTPMLAHMCDVTGESTVHVGDDCVVTDLVCVSSVIKTHMNFWPRDLRVWRQFRVQFGRGSPNVEASVKDIHPSGASCSSVLMTARFVLTRRFPSTLQNLVRNLFVRCR